MSVELSRPEAGEPPSGGAAAAGAGRWVALVVICMAALVLSLDTTVLQLAVPNLIRDLHPSSSQILWIVDIYGFALSGLLVTMGGLGDRIGRKKLLLTGCVLFGAASLGAAYAQSAEQLIAARALLGVAGATVYPTTLSIIRNVFTDPKERTTAIAIWSGLISGGLALGPIVAGPMLTHFWWGSVFLINPPVMLLVLVVGFFVVPESRNPEPGRLDLPSVLLSVVGIIGVVYAVQESVRDGSGEPRIIAAAAVGLVSLALFVRRQTRLTEPLIDVRLFADRYFSGAVVANTGGLFAFIGVTLLLSQYFQLGHDWTPLRTGMAMLPPIALAIFFGPVVALLVPVFGRMRIIAVGLGLIAVSMFMYGFVDADSGYLAVMFPLLVQAVGATATFTLTADIIINSAPKERSGAASAIATTCAELGGALGIAVLGTLLNAAYHSGIKVPAGLPAPAVDAVRDSIGGAVHVAADLPAGLAGQVMRSAKDAFAHGLHAATFTTAVFLVVLTVVAAAALRGVPDEFPEDSQE
jgi:DHA2 family multidrug resistance protein-like MFS transporter